LTCRVVRVIARFAGPPGQSPRGDGQRRRDDGSDKKPESDSPLPLGRSLCISFVRIGFFCTLLLRLSRGLGGLA
jgi:hypothetical protein